MTNRDSDGQPLFPAIAFDETLLDFHLGRLSIEQQEQLLARIQSDPELCAQHKALNDIFGALGLIGEVSQPAVDLESRVLSRIAENNATGRSATNQAPTSRAPTVRERVLAYPIQNPLAHGRDSDGRSDPERAQTVGWENERVIRLHSIRDVMAVAAMIVLAVGVGVPGLLHMRERGQRTMCAANLASIGRGLQSYAGTFGDNLPFAGWNNASSWRPTGEQGVALVPNRKHLFPLVRTQYVPTSVFVCPSARDIAMPMEQIRQRDDFLESRNISYANQNMAGVRPSLKSDANLVLLADDNPLFADGQPLLNFAAQKLGLSDAQQANSRSHGGVGQNILRLDGHTEWTTNPNCGIANDNIWTLTHIQEYTGREGPMSATDSHLLK